MTNNIKIRTFFAVELKNKVTIDNIAQLQLELGQIVQPVKMVELENLHLTIRFLGNIDINVAEKLYAFTEKSINNRFFTQKEIMFNVIGLKDFNKRVFYVDLKGPTEILTDINQKIEDHLVSYYDFERERKFRTHLTIGRLKRRRKNKGGSNKNEKFDKIRYSKLKEEYRNKNLGDFVVSKILLKKSILTAKGPIYETLIF
jgi:2'-5' RNA ligase